MIVASTSHSLQASNVSVKSKLQHPPRAFDFLKVIVQILPYPGQNAVPMPHTRVHSGDQMRRVQKSDRQSGSDQLGSTWTNSDRIKK